MCRKLNTFFLDRGRLPPGRWYWTGFHGHWARSAILLCLFTVYLCNGAGALDILLIPGFDIHFHPQVLVSVLSGILEAPAGFQAVSLILMLITGCLLSVMLPRLKPIAASMLAATAGLVHFYLYLHEAGARPILSMEYSLLIVLILFTANALMMYFAETHTRQRILKVFGQYVPPEVVSGIIRHPEALDLRGEARRMTVLFCDLQDFSSAAEQLNPKQVTMLLNAYFDRMSEVLHSYDATIDKYIGDAVMAFWGAPLPRPDHARMAVLAALDMHREINLLAGDFIRRGWPGLALGIGINTGMMNVGNMGSKYRLTYTVVGDAVNLAARVESLTRRYRRPILVSETTMAACPDIAFRSLDIVRVKGKQRLTGVYEPLCPRSALNTRLEARLKLHREAVEAYFDGDHEKAAVLFRQLQAADPTDGYYEYMLEKMSEK